MYFSPLTVEQEQIQKKTFTNWVNAQLAKVGLNFMQFSLSVITSFVWMKNKTLIKHIVY